MKSFMKKIDLFCYRHPKFGISNLMLYIVIGNVAVLLFSAMDTTGLLIRSLEFSTAGLLRGQVWRLLTFVLVPESGGLLFLLMLYFYYFIGNVLEREWGPGRFTIYYLMGMALTILYGVASYFITGDDLGLTGSYINLSMFLPLRRFFRMKLCSLCSSFPSRLNGWPWRMLRILPIKSSQVSAMVWV